MAQKWIPYDWHYHAGNNAFLKIRVRGKEEAVIRGACILSGVEIIAYMPPPESFFDNQRGWKSEFRGEIPPKDGSYVVQLAKPDLRRTFWDYITAARFRVKEQGWLGLPQNYVVIAWREFPKP